MSEDDRRTHVDDFLEVKSDLYPDADGVRWTLEARDGSGRRGEGRSEDIPAAYSAIRELIEQWYPDDPVTGETRIVRLVR